MVLKPAKATQTQLGKVVMSLKCDWMFILVSSKCNPVKSG